MVKIEIPIEVELVENEKLGLSNEDPPIFMASIYINHIMMITEQPNKTALITIVGGLDVVTTLTYSDVMALLK